MNTESCEKLIAELFKYNNQIESFTECGEIDRIKLRQLKESRKIIADILASICLDKK